MVSSERTLLCLLDECIFANGCLLFRALNFMFNNIKALCGVYDSKICSVVNEAYIIWNMFLVLAYVVYKCKKVFHKTERLFTSRDLIKQMKQNATYRCSFIFSVVKFNDAILEPLHINRKHKTLNKLLHYNN